MPPSIRVLGPLLTLALSAGLWAGEPKQLSQRDREDPRDSAAMFPRAVRFDGPLESLVGAPGTPDAGSPGASHDRVVPAAFAEPLPSAEGKADWNRPKEPSSGGAAGRGGPSDSDRLRTPSGGPKVTPLPAPGQGGQAREATSSAGPGGPQGLLTVVSSLGMVLGLFFIVAWAMRRATPGAGALLPGEVVEVLGRAPLANRQHVHLIRLGSKLVLISVTPAGVEALSEVTDPEEVQQLIGLCRQAQPNSSTAMFRQVLQQFTGEHERVRLRGRSDDAGREGERHVEASDG